MGDVGNGDLRRKGGVEEEGDETIWRDRIRKER